MSVELVEAAEKAPSYGSYATAVTWPYAGSSIGMEGHILKSFVLAADS
jgi:hypothetical protein